MGRARPSEYMYRDLKSFAHLSNIEAAQILLSDRPFAGGAAPRDRALKPTSLSRDVVGAEPGAHSLRFFADLPACALTITSKILGRVTGPDARERVCAHYREVAPGMSEALDACGRSGRLYANAVEHVCGMPLLEERDRCSLHVLLFIATGCLGDPRQAAQIVEDFARDKLGSSFRTQATEAGEGLPEEGEGDEDVMLGLERVKGGAVSPSIYVLDPAGTEVGTLADVPDVEADVTRRHLRLWREGGRWLCADLGSTNGSWLISGADGSRRRLEPPVAGAHGAELRPREVLPADVLQLGSRTQFFVIAVTGR